MKTVSAGFDSAISADFREIFGKIIFRQIDIDAQADVSVTSTSTETITTIDRVNDGIENSQINYATFESDRWLLNGTFALLPESSPYTNMGWWSEQLSDASTFLFSPEITIESTGTVDHTTVGFSIIFDEPNNEYAEEFDIIYKDSLGATIETVNVTGNTLALYVDETPVADWRTIELVIKKWCLGSRRARIQELQFGVVEVYTNEDDLFNFSVEEIIDVVSSKIESDKLEFEIYNENDAYDILNPSGKYLYLQKKQEIEAYLGVRVGGVIEYASCGVFYLDDWKTDKSRLSAKFTAYDKFSLLNQTRYRKGVYGSNDLKTLAESVLSDYGFDSADYNVDSALSGITVTGFLPITTHKEVIKQICLAGQAIAYCDGNGVIQIKQNGSTSTGFEIRLEDAPKYPILELDKLIRQVDVEVVTYTEAGTSTTIFEADVDVDGTEQIWIEYDPSTTVNASISVGSLDSVTYYTSAALLTITHTGTTTVTITGKKLTKNTYVRNYLTGEETGEVVSVKSLLIDTTPLANDVGNWVKGELTKRNLFTSVWRHNPKVQLGDLINIENQFETSSDILVYKQNYTYDGGLKGTLKARN